MKEAARILRLHQEEIALSLMNEIAKNHKNALSEVARTADLIEYVAEQGIST